MTEPENTAAGEIPKAAKIYVAGHRGLVGSALVRALDRRGYKNLICRTSAELELRDQAQVREFYAQEKPEYVLLAAAKVGGIVANNASPAEFLYDNLMIEANLIHGAQEIGVKKLLFLGSTCIYPRMAAQPLREDSLLTGPLEPTNEWYAVAKIAGIKMCQAYRRQYGCNFIAVMPTNLYGPGDNFDLETSHVLPAMIRKFHEGKKNGARSVVIWGTGTPRREFCHVDDCADAILFLMDEYSGEEIVNIGVGADLTILELAEMVREVVGFEGEIELDETRPDGTPRKLVDVGRLFAMGWRPSIELRDGVESAYEWFQEHWQAH